MRRVFGLLILFIGIAIIYFLNNSLTIGDASLPPIGKLLNPFSGIWQNAENKKDYTNFRINSKHVSGEIDIVFDLRMVPHIYADNLKDALFAQGYVEAYHRLFQMDISTRAADGKLSEILGRRVLDYDKSQLRLGLGYAADNAVKGWKKHPEEYEFIESYTQGINHLISSLGESNYPMEYKLLDFKPTPWSVRKSALFLKAMSQTLAGYEEDVEMSNALKLLGESDFKAIFPDFNPKDIPVASGPYDYVNFVIKNDDKDLVLSSFLRSIPRYKAPEGVGSNNWAVAGSRTVTGSPMLANDPHLGLSLPSVWYEIAITTPEFSARGATLLGVPGIMIGFNQNIAWGETNVGHDVMDYHKIQWTNNAQTKYIYNNEVYDVSYRVEKIKIKGEAEELDSVKYTIWGPVVNDSAGLALRWIIHDESQEIELMTFVDGMRCKDYNEYLTKTSVYYAPAQNFIYADKSGEIGIRVNGKLPIKSKGQGRTIARGDTSNASWRGFIPTDHLPQERNPKKGYVSSTNQWSTSEDYPYYYNGAFEAYRGRIINRLLSSDSSISLSDMMSFQQNTYSIEAEEALPVLLNHLDSTFHSTKQYQQLQDWDFRYTAESKSASFFNLFYNYFQEILWDEIYDYKDSLVLPIPDSWVTNLILLENNESKFIDIQRTPKIENLSDLCNLAFQKTMEDSTSELEWSDLRGASIPHLTRIPVLSYSFDENHKVDGYRHTLNAMQSDFGPSWRMVISLEENPYGFGIYPGGQSGNPASPFYKNTIEKWRTGQYDTLYIYPNKADITSPLFTITISNEN